MGHRICEVHNHLDVFCNFDNSILNFIMASDMIDVKQELVKWKEEKIYKVLEITLNNCDNEWIDNFNAKHGMKYILRISINIPSAFEYMHQHNVWKNLLLFNKNNEIIQANYILPQDVLDQRYEKYFIFCDYKIPSNIFDELLEYFK